MSISRTSLRFLHADVSCLTGWLTGKPGSKSTSYSGWGSVSFFKCNEELVKISPRLCNFRTAISKPNFAALGSFRKNYPQTALVLKIVTVIIFYFQGLGNRIQDYNVRLIRLDTKSPKGLITTHLGVKFLKREVL